jgi:hypothetical protein
LESLEVREVPASYYWAGTGTTGQADVAANWTNGSGGAAHTSMPDSDDDLTFPSANNTTAIFDTDIGGTFRTITSTGRSATKAVFNHAVEFLEDGNTFNDTTVKFDNGATFRGDVVIDGYTDFLDDGSGANTVLFDTGVFVSVLDSVGFAGDVANEGTVSFVDTSEIDLFDGDNKFYNYGVVYLTGQGTWHNDDGDTDHNIVIGSGGSIQKEDSGTWLIQVGIFMESGSISIVEGTLALSGGYSGNSTDAIHADWNEWASLPTITLYDTILQVDGHHVTMYDGVFEALGGGTYRSTVANYGNLYLQDSVIGFGDQVTDCNNVFLMTNSSASPATGCQLHMSDSVIEIGLDWNTGGAPFCDKVVANRMFLGYGDITVSVVRELNRPNPLENSWECWAISLAYNDNVVTQISYPSGAGLSYRWDSSTYTFEIYRT